MSPSAADSCTREQALLPDLVRESARTVPERLAVSGCDGDVTYAELDALADRAAGVLEVAGVRTGDRVAVWLDKAAQTVALLQGVLRVGAAYVPLDPLSPPARASAIVDDCRPSVVVTTRERAAGFAGLPPATRVLEIGAGEATRPWPLLDAATSPPPSPPGTVDPGHLAYVLYTSGSTGTPKGVCISHRNALAFVQWAVRALGARQVDRFANHAPLHFDLSVLDLYAAFRTGASVHLVPATTAYAPRVLVRFLHEQAITVWYSVPSVLLLMMREGGLLEGPPPPALRALLFAGEPFPVKHLRQLVEAWPATRFLNLYGPTETNVCTFHEVTDLDPRRTLPVPIGRACSGDRVWAETAGGSPAVAGQTGELVVEGPTVMLGYWGRPPQCGPYRTGDLVRVLEDGAFEYVGRIDNMVKIRGVRMELGEIEAVLLEHPHVVQAAVVVTGANLDSRVVAFVVSEGDRDVGLLELKRHCAARLPQPVTVDALHRVTSVPRTPNGKTDRRRLAAMASAGTAAPARPPS